MNKLRRSRKGKVPAPPSTSPVRRQSLPASGVSLHPEPRNEQERRQFAEADRRDRALLWTDDRPFSIYKS